MATSDDFKQKLKAGNLSQALRVALSNAIELEITTWVVPIDADPLEVQTPKPGYRMRTRINMVDGDIQNEIGSQFLSNAPYAELQEFHLSQVKRGRDTIRKNLQSLETLFSVWLDPMRQPTVSTAPTVSATQKPTQLPPPTTVAGNLPPSEVTPDPAIEMGGLPSENLQPNPQPYPELPVSGSAVLDSPIDIPATTPSGENDSFSEPALADPNYGAGTIAPDASVASPSVAEPVFTEPVPVEPVPTEPTSSTEFAAPTPVAPISTAADPITPPVSESLAQPVDIEGTSFGIDSSLSGGISGTLELAPSLEESLPSLGTASSSVRSPDLPILPDLLPSPTQIDPHPETLVANIAPSLEESLATPSIIPTPVAEPASSPSAVTPTSNEANLIDFDPSLFGEPTLPRSSAPIAAAPIAAVQPSAASPELFIEPSGNTDPHAAPSELFVEPKMEVPKAESLQFFSESAISSGGESASPIVSSPSQPAGLINLPVDTTTEDTTFDASLATFDSVGVTQTSFASPSLELPLDLEASSPATDAFEASPSQSDSMADFDLDSLTPPFAEPSPEEFDLSFPTLAVAGNVDAEAKLTDTSMADFDLSALETPSDSLSLEMETINLGESDWLEAHESDETIMEPDFGLGSLESDATTMEPDFGLGSLSNALDDEFDETIFEPDLPIDAVDEDEIEDATVLEPDLLSGLLNDDEFDETILEPDLLTESQPTVDSSLADLFAEPATPASDPGVDGETESSESLAALFAEPPSLADYPPLTTPESSLEAAANSPGLDDLDFSASSASPELEQSLAALFAEPALDDPKTSSTSGLDDEDALSALFGESSEDESSNLFADLSVADAEAYLANHPELGLDLGADALDLDSITLDLDSPQSKRQSGDDRHPLGG